MSIAQLIGNTPVLEYAPHRFAKLEGFNPAGSSKDRVARSILLGAEKEGRLQPGMRLACIGFGGGLTWGGMLLTVKGSAV